MSVVPDLVVSRRPDGE